MLEAVASCAALLRVLKGGASLLAEECARLGDVGAVSMAPQLWAASSA